MELIAFNGRITDATHVGLMVSNVRPTSVEHGVSSLQVAPGATDLVNYLVDLAPQTHDNKAALLLAVGSTWAYSDALTLSRVMVRRGLADNYCRHIHISNEALLVNTSAFLVQSKCGRVVILSFRGTDPSHAISWLTEGISNPDLYDLVGGIHGGIYRNLMVVFNDIIEHLGYALQGKAITKTGQKEELKEELKEEQKEDSLPNQLQALYITGHGLGGAMAAVAAAKIAKEQKAIRNVLRGVYTFGQPMVGDANFAENAERDLGGMVFRHVHDKDLVARVPLLSNRDFRHFGQEYHSTEGGWAPARRNVSPARTALFGSRISATSRLLQQLPFVRGLKLPLSWEDHAPLHYLRCSIRGAQVESEFA
jgi:hypothetical protein